MDQVEWQTRWSGRVVDQVEWQSGGPGGPGGVAEWWTRWSGRVVDQVEWQSGGPGGVTEWRSCGPGGVEAHNKYNMPFPQKSEETFVQEIHILNL